MKKTVAIIITVCTLMLVLAGCGANNNGYTEDTEYYLYFGLNDKDTGEQVYTKAQAIEKIKNVCLDEKTGFTVYEAFGAYLENETPVTNETVVFTLIMTTEKQAQSIAEKAKAELNLASVLIVRKPVVYKFA